MHKGRIEAFSDAVIAIIMTVMVLELKAPRGADLASLEKVAPEILGYALSFVFLGIYWNNHHHMFQAVKHVDGWVLWANQYLLFWLSLIPFTTAWMSETGYSRAPVATYGADLLMCAIAYTFLTAALVRVHGKHSEFAESLGRDFKGKSSLALYAVGILLSWNAPWVACGIYTLVALIWLVPDRRFAPRPEGPV